MKGRWKVAAVAAMGLSLGFLVLTSAGHEQRALAQSAPKAATKAAKAPAPKTAAEAFKNIKVLKNIPAYELIPTMEFISSSLGVHCDYCHVEHHFDRDTKKTKLRARDMMRMEFAIDKADFHGHLRVTCDTCHNGSAHPAAMPAIAEAGATQPQPAHPEEHGKHFNMASLPKPDAIIARYVQALGGAEGLRKVKSRVITGTVTFFGHAVPVTIYSKAPNERASVMKLPRGQGLTVYNGHEGWQAMMPRPPHQMEGSELDEARLEADFYFPLNIAKDFSTLRPRPPLKVDGHEAYRLMGMRPGKPPVELDFDEQSGLLVRLVYLTQTAVGLLPEQTDFADYREVNGVKVPFRETVARPDEHSTLQVTSIQQNVPISSAKFAIPATGHTPAGM
ncbi:MAG: c-type cytochrome [Acidobacteriota bacterium]